jgi:predicted transcriptional regulator
MRHRSRTEIIAEILEIANIGNKSNNDDGDGYGYYPPTKYKITDDASLNYTQMNEYVTMLTDNGLLSYDIDTRTFKTTEKGQRFLRIYNNVGNVMKQQAQPASKNSLQRNNPQVSVIYDKRGRRRG